MLRLAHLAALIALSTPAYAQSSLGFTALEASVSASDDATHLSATADLAITEYHGAQFDLSYSFTTTDLGAEGPVDGLSDGIGQIATHLYMTPRPGQKYGLAFSLSDLNGEAYTYMQAGVAGLFTVTPELDLELRGGMGMVTSSGSDLDWITAGLGATWQPSPSVAVYARYDLTEFQELTFDAMAHEATIGLRRQIGSGPVSAFAEATHDWLSGPDAASGVTTLTAGVSFSFGAPHGEQPLFHVADPMRQILRRGLQ